MMTRVLTTQDRLEAIAQHIERAACVIEEDGWARATFFADEKGHRVRHFPDCRIQRFCIVGALYATCDDLVIGYQLEEIVDYESSQSYDAQCALCEFLGQTPSSWNDIRAKDKRDVVVHMLDCSTWLRKKEGEKWLKGTMR